MYDYQSSVSLCQGKDGIFHEPILNFRCVSAYATCSLKPLAVKISLALKAVYSEICRYTNMHCSK